MERNNICTIYIARHGETDWNFEHKIQGQTDVPLNSIGEIQARELGKQFQSIHFDRVFSSDLLRAKRTAEIALLAREVAVETTEALRERRFGGLEGKPTSVFRELDEYVEKLTEAERISHRFTEGYESDEDLLARVLPFLREVAVAFPNKNILVISHGGVMRALVDKLVGKHNPKRRIGNTALLVLLSDGVAFEIKEAQNIDLD